MRGPCKKQTVTAVLTAKSGDVFIGTNYCNNAQSVCPRDAEGFKTGEGYHLCKDACDQVGHAEEVAISLAGDKAFGSVIELYGHTYACDNCKKVASLAGVEKIIIKDI